MELAGLGALSGIGEALSDRRGIADKFDTFLQLLTTQLRNQNPLDPLDTNEFTSQLVQFSSVEQAVKTNQNLETLLRLSAASAATAAVTYLGKSVTVDGATGELKDGRARWSYASDGAVANATVTIRDSEGRLVFSEDRPFAAGAGDYAWDGRRSDGGLAAPGSYTISIVGRDAGGSTVPVKTSFTGTVDGIDLTGSEPVLLIANKRINLSEVKSVAGNP